MRLTNVEIDGVGRFGTPARIEGLEAGVNILAAGNEAGKSTFFRAIRTCLFERHGSRNRDVMALATDGLSLPVTIKISFERGGQSYEISKTFLKSTSASLRRGGVEIARNTAADEELWNLLGIAHGSSGSRSVDEAAFGILWVDQGKSFAAPDPSEAATSALNAAIQQEVGMLVGGERARQVLGSLSAELAKLATRTGKPKTGSPLAEALEQSEVIAQSLREAKERLELLDSSMEELAKLRSERTILTAPADLAKLRSDLEDAQRLFDAGEQAAAALRIFESDERQTATALGSQVTQLESLMEHIQRIDRNRERSAKLAGELSPLKAEETDAREKVAASYVRIGDIDKQLQSVEAEESRLRRIAAVMQKSSARAALESRLNAFRDYEARLAHTEAGLRVNSVDAAAVSALDEIERDADKLTARLEASAAQLSVERHGSSVVTINGQRLESKADRAITEPLTITVSDDVTIRITPANENLAATQKQRDALQRRLQQLLAKHSVNTSAQLRNARVARNLLEEAQRGLTAEKSALGAKDPVSAEIADIAAELSRIESEIERIHIEYGSDALLSPEKIGLRLVGLQQSRDTLQPERSQCEAIIKDRNAVISKIADSRGTLQGQMTEITNQLKIDLTTIPDEQRTETMRAAEDKKARLSEDQRIAALALAEKRRSTPDAEELERRRNRVSRLKVVVHNRESQISALAQRIANLEGQIISAGGDGLGERVANLGDQLEIINAEAARQNAKVETLRLLHEIIFGSYEKRREQLNSPLRRHLKPFLNDVFPQSEIEIGDGFAVTGLRRNGPCSEHFDRLSAGTKEQIAVLVRLAMGAMICERGEEVPIILDDALVFSDDVRIEQMFDALNRAGKNQQVIVFTCRARSFASLGGRQLQIG